MFRVAGATEANSRATNVGRAYMDRSPTTRELVRKRVRFVSEVDMGLYQTRIDHPAVQAGTVRGRGVQDQRRTRDVLGARTRRVPDGPQGLGLPQDHRRGRPGSPTRSASLCSGYWTAATG